MTSSLRQTLVLAALALVAGTASNQAASPKRHLKWVGDWKGKAEVPAPTPTPLAATGAAAPTADPVELDSEQVRKEHAQPGVLFLDARRSEQYNQGHIPGARDFAVWEGDIDAKVLSLAMEVPPDTRIVVYCMGGECDDSHILRNKLIDVHFSNVVIYTDGWPDWLKAGLPVETVGH